MQIFRLSGQAAIEAITPAVFCFLEVGDRRDACPPQHALPSARFIQGSLTLSGMKRAEAVWGDRPHPYPLPMNLLLVAAELTRRSPLIRNSFRLLTSAATVLGFKARTWVGRNLSPRGQRSRSR